MCQHIARQADEAQRSRAAAIKFGQARGSAGRPRTAHRRGRPSARTDGGDHRDPLGGVEDQQPCLRVERRQDLGLGQSDQSGPSMISSTQFGQRGAAAGRFGRLRQQREQLVDHGACAALRSFAAMATRCFRHFFDRRQPCQTPRISRTRMTTSARAAIAAAPADQPSQSARAEKVADQAVGPQTDRQRHQQADAPSESAQETRPPRRPCWRPAAAPRWHRAVAGSSRSSTRARTGDCRRPELRHGADLRLSGLGSGLRIGFGSRATLPARCGNAAGCRRVIAHARWSPMQELQGAVEPDMRQRQRQAVGACARAGAGGSARSGRASVRRLGGCSRRRFNRSKTESGFSGQVPGKYGGFAVLPSNVFIADRLAFEWGCR